jgi:RNA polymerase sigma-70 factor (ECF subfamily)
MWRIGLYRVVSLAREIFSKFVRNRSQMRSVLAASALIGEMFGWLRQQFGRLGGHGRSKARAAERHRLQTLRLRRVFDDSHDLVWRTLRHLGTRADRLEDSFQQVYAVVSQHLNEIEPGQERAFTYRVALSAARSAAQSNPRAVSDASDEHAYRERPADLLSDRKRLLELCDRLLDRLAPSLREVFVLHELEGLRDREIAAVLEIPRGAVRARLLCARLCVRDDIEAIVESRTLPEFSRG